VIIVAGGTDSAIEKEMERYRDHLLKAFETFQGTIISGGTMTGIPGIVGVLKEELDQKGKSQLVALGYLPASIPKDVKVDDRYDELIYTEGSEFSPRQLLQNWIDLIATGGKPQDVLVFGINGGEIAALEYRLALALGATVGLIQSSGRAVKELIPDANWWNAAKLLWLPDDPMTLRAFVNPAQPTLDNKVQEKIAREVHSRFLAEKRHETLDPAMMPWDLLRDDLKVSNLGQIAYMTKILAAAGYGIRKAKGQDNVQKFAPGEIEAMAAMEHGRWTIERLRSGWRYGPVRDPANKVSPYLVPWEDLTKKVKGYDRDAVKNWLSLLKKVGLEVYGLRKSRGRSSTGAAMKGKTVKKSKPARKGKR
jgi:hypothetical protein